MFQVDCFWFQLLCVSDFLEAFLADCTIPQSTTSVYYFSCQALVYLTIRKQKFSKTKCSFPELSYKVGPWSRHQGVIVCVISNRARASRSSSLIVLHSVHLLLLTISRNSVFRAITQVERTWFHSDYFYYSLTADISNQLSWHLVVRKKEMIS